MLMRHGAVWRFEARVHALPHGPGGLQRVCWEDQNFREHAWIASVMQGSWSDFPFGGSRTLGEGGALGGPMQPSVPKIAPGIAAGSRL